MENSSTLESNTPYSTPSPTPSTSAVLPTFPSIKQLFIESWHSLTQNFLKLFGIDIISFILQIVITAGFGLFIFKTLNLSVEMFSNPDKSKLIETLSNFPSHTVEVGISFAIFLIISILLFTLKTIMLTAVLGSEPSEPLRTHFKTALKNCLPFLIIGFAVSLLSFGGFFLLFFPAIVISLFLMFSRLENILNGQKVIASLKNSVQVVSQNFGDVFIRLIVFALITILITVFVPNVVTKIDPESGILIQLLRIVLNLFIGWYGLAYLVKLYQHAKNHTDNSKPSNIIWIFIVSALGWLIALLIGTAFIKNNGLELIKTGISQGFQNSFNPSLASQNANAITKAPSSCGVSIPVPETTDQNEDITRKWIFEEIAMDPSNFYILDKDTYPNEKVLGSFVAYKDESSRLGGESFKVGYPGINIYCVENTKKLNLDEFVGLVKTNKNYTVEVDKKYTWGEIEAVAITLKQFDDKGEQTFNDIGNLAVSKDGNRLLYFRRWGTEDADPIKEKLETDIQVISNNISYKEVPIELILPSTPTTQTQTTKKEVSASCKTLQIPSGEFASNKCYLNSDYNELNGYLNSFNTAAFNYNSAASQANVTCGGFTDSFKQKCEQSKKDMEAAKASMEGFRNAINAVIARGK